MQFSRQKFGFFVFFHYLCITIPNTFITKFSAKVQKFCLKCKQ